MPTFHRLSNAKICIYADDHDPPHFHLIGPGWAGIIDIDTLKVCRGTIPRKDFIEAVEWATRNRAALILEWKRLNERD